jgi:hypothetical protein
MLDEQWLHSIGYVIRDGIAQRAPASPTHAAPRPPAHATEEDDHRALIAWVDLYAHAREPRLAWLYHIPNGGARSKSTAGRLKAMGTRAGVPDLHLAVACRGYHGMWLELKTPGQHPSPSQQHWLDGLASQGFHTGVYTNWLAAAQQLCWYVDRPDLAATLERGVGE